MNPKLKNFLKPIFHFFYSIGFDARRFSSIRNYPRYRRDLFKFKKSGGVVTHKDGILVDYNSEAGSASGHYFHQDLLVASYINKNKPKRHIDIGSRIDGFVAHVASFRNIDVMDVRKLQDTGHKRISFIQADLMEENCKFLNISDSISCLHAIEHFGLGRYGDSIDPDGHKKGFNNILGMLKKGGILYISFPIANKNEIHFNANRVFSPKDIFTWANYKKSIKLQNFDYVDDLGNLHRNINIDSKNIDVVHGCGIYTFKKIY